MKILKPGKVERRKFVCHKCGCTFAAENTEASIWGYVTCPQEKCCTLIHWQNSEPYEEPTQDKTADNAEIIRILCEHCDANYSEAANVAQILINNGVTVRRDR